MNQVSWVNWHGKRGCLLGLKAVIRTLLPTTELLNTLLLVVLGVEADTDAYACVILDTLALLLALVGGASSAVALALDDEAALASGHELFEDVGEFARDLLEGALDGLVLALIEHLNKLLDRILGFVELGASRRQVRALLGEDVVLLERFL